MNSKLTMGLLVTGLLIGGGQLLAPDATTPATAVVAHAAIKAATVASGTVGTSDWNVTDDGVLHVGAGDLPEAVKTVYSPLYDPVQEAAAQGVTVTKVVFEGTVHTAEQGSYTFGHLNTVEAYENLENLDTSRSTSLAGLFAANESLQKIDISSLDVSQVTSLEMMFGTNYKLASLKVGNLATAKVTSLLATFSNLYQLKELDLSGLDVSGLETTYMMLTNDYRLQKLNLGNWQLPASSKISSVFALSKQYDLRELTLSADSQVAAGTFPDIAGGGYPSYDQTIYTGKWENQEDQYLPVGTAGKRVYTSAELNSLYDGTHQDELSGNATYIWEPLETPEAPVVAPVTVHYVDQAGKSIHPDDELTGELGADFTAQPIAIAGYTFEQADGATSGTFTTSAHSVTFVYRANESGNSSGGNAGGATDSSDASNSSSTGPTTDSSANGSSDTQASDAGDTVTNMSVSSVKKIGFYRSATFTAKNRVRWFAKQPQQKRPQFVVLKTAESKQGRLRYYVKDVTRGSKTYGQKGYITTKSAYVRPTYAQSRPKAITVINDKGLNSYKTASLKGKVRHYRKGQRLTVKKLVRHNLTTRYQLTNGQYVSANLNFSKTVK